MIIFSIFFFFFFVNQDSECSRGNSPNATGKGEDRNKERHVYNNQHTHHHSQWKKPFKGTAHGI